MEDQLLLGLWRCWLPIPPQIWQRVVKGEANLEVMGADHHRVRNLAVSELPREGKPLPPEWISEKLDLPLSKVISILDELEQNLTFLFRNPQGDVTWAYPVTIEKTPHLVTFSTGEQVYSA